MIQQRQTTRRGFLAIGGAAAFATATDSLRASIIRGVNETEEQQILKLGEEFRSTYQLPGVSLAMTYRGQLKLLACFGFADREQGTMVTPQHQFRIASVSKPITSVAILRLAEQGKLSLSDRVFGAQGRLNLNLEPLIHSRQQLEWIETITIQNLLEHTAGGWSNKGGEAPMFAEAALGLSHPELIAWTLRNMPLGTKPGTKYAYSNFGYCLLGRVIEKVTDQSYEDAVRHLVLTPVGATSTRVGRRSENERRLSEVVYYDKHDPYGQNMDVARMDAHGGWISTPSDLVRFVNHVDAFPSPEDIISNTSLRQMTSPTIGNYAKGWRVNQQNNWWHTGGFNGGSSILARINDGHSWAVLVNTRSKAPGYFQALDQFPWRIKRLVKKWKNHDLFVDK